MLCILGSKMIRAPLSLIQPEPGQSRYAALAAALRERMVAGEWPPGTALPAEAPSPPSMAWRWARCAERWNCWPSKG